MAIVFAVSPMGKIQELVNGRQSLRRRRSPFRGLQIDTGVESLRNELSVVLSG